MMALSLAAALRVVYAAALTPGAPIAQRAGISPLDYFLAQGPAILRYLRLIVLPRGFTIDPGIPIPAPAQGLLAWTALAALTILALRRFPAEGRWFAAGLLLLLPTSSFFPAADLAADRRLYLPMTAFAAAAGLLLARLRPAIPTAICTVLAILSLARMQVWANDESLWREASEAAPQKLRPKLQLARTVPPAQALPILAEARRLAPDDPAVASQTGTTLLAAGRPAEALTELGRALALNPRGPGNLNNRGAALEALGQTEAALADYRRALAIDPTFAIAKENLRRLTASPR